MTASSRSFGLPLALAVSAVFDGARVKVLQGEGLQNPFAWVAYIRSPVTTDDVFAVLAEELAEA